MFKIYYTKQALKDGRLLKQVGFADIIKNLVSILEDNPYRNPPPYERLMGNLAGFYSRRINIQHRLAYQVFKEEQAVKIVRMWGHYE